MIKKFCGVALMAVLAVPAFAQEKGEYKNATRTKGPDMSIVQSAVAELSGGAECNAVFTVSVEGKPVDVEPNCTDKRYDSYIVAAIESMEYEPEIFDGEIFATEGVKQPFVFGVVEAADSEDGKPPVVKTNLEAKDIERAINRVDEEGSCEIEFTVGTNGKPKDIEPNCTPDKFDSHIEKAVERMEYEPGMREGVAVDWPGVKLPLNLSTPE